MFFIYSSILSVFEYLLFSKYVGFAAFDKYKKGILEDSISLNALYLKKSSAEEKVGK